MKQSDEGPSPRHLTSLTQGETSLGLPRASFAKHDSKPAAPTMVDAASLDPCGQRPVQMHRPHTNDRRRTSLNDHPKALSSAHRLNDQHSPPKPPQREPYQCTGHAKGLTAATTPPGVQPTADHQAASLQRRNPKAAGHPSMSWRNAKPPRRDQPKGF